jgi:hypothetical protein
MNNLHVTLTTFRHETRIIKQIRSVMSANIFNKTFVVARFDSSLDPTGLLQENVEITRLKLLCNRIGMYWFIKVFSYFELFFRVLTTYRSLEISVITIHSVRLLIFGVIWKYFFNAKLVYDAHELETEVDNLTLLPKFFYKVITQKENYC